MTGDTEKYGSDELSQAEFDTYESHHADLQDELRRVAETSDEAKRFLQTQLGISIRKVLLSEKMTAMKNCAETVLSPDLVLSKHKRRYDVVCEVERVFALIISDGEEALRQLSMTIGDEDDR